jgi:hypothetical protein
MSLEHVKTGRRGLIAASILVAFCGLGGLLLTQAWAGHHGVTLLLDPADGGPDAASCDILRATSQPTAHGKIRHTVTTRGEVGYGGGLTGPPVVLVGKGEHPKAPGWHIKTLSAAARGVKARVRKDHVTVVYTLDRHLIQRKLPKRQRAYFWRATTRPTCTPGDPLVDRAPHHAALGFTKR